MSNKEIQEAKKVLEEISEDEHEQYLAELRQKYIMDQKAIEDAGYDKGLKAGIEQGIKQGIKQGIEQGVKQGIKQGIEQGVKQGLEQGKKKENLKIAKRMLDEKIDLTTISKITGLSIQELKNL